MTIAVGAKYPWGDLNRLPPNGSKTPEAIILASDSRFSEKLSTDDVVPVSDVGTKLFSLGNDFAAVYAGMSRAGELCLEELRWKLSRQNNPSSAHSKEIAQETFKSVYRHQIASLKLRPDDAPLFILIGACNKRSQAELYLFSYATGFKPEPVTGLKALGWPETVSRFDSLLKIELIERVDHELSLRQKYSQIPMASWVPMPIKSEEVAILITAVLHRIIETGADRTVGGMVQCAVITAEGVTLPEISYSPDPTNEGPGWTRVTARMNELITTTAIPRTFGLYNLSD